MRLLAPSNDPCGQKSAVWLSGEDITWVNSNYKPPRCFPNERSEFIAEEARILKLEPLSLLHLAGNRK